MDELFGLHSIIGMCCRTPSISQKHMCCKWLTRFYSQTVNCIAYDCSHQWGFMVPVPSSSLKNLYHIKLLFLKPPSHSCALVLCTCLMGFPNIKCYPVKRKTMYILWIPSRSQHSIEDGIFAQWIPIELNKLNNNSEDILNIFRPNVLEYLQHSLNFFP